jgi:hypothetical protein
MSRLAIRPKRQASRSPSPQVNKQPKKKKWTPRDFDAELVQHLGGAAAAGLSYDDDSDDKPNNNTVHKVDAESVNKFVDNLVHESAGSSTNKSGNVYPGQFVDKSIRKPVHKSVGPSVNQFDNNFVNNMFVDNSFDMAVGSYTNYTNQPSWAYEPISWNTNMIAAAG